MKKLALLFGLLFAFPAFAADNAVIVTPGVGVTMKSKDIGSGVQAMQPIISDTAGVALPIQAAGADGVSNTTSSLPSYGFPLVFNGTTWDRWRGDLTNGGFVNVKASVLPTGAGTSANQTTINASLGTINTTLGTLATHADAVAAIPAGTNNIGSTSPAPNVTATACSGTIATGGTAQNAFTAQTTLHGFTIANIDTTEPLWISFTTTAAASGTDSYPLPAATASTFAGFGSFTSPPGLGLNHALSVIAATTSHKYSCTWW